MVWGTVMVSVSGEKLAASNGWNIKTGASAPVISTNIFIDCVVAEATFGTHTHML